MLHVALALALAAPQDLYLLDDDRTIYRVTDAATAQAGGATVTPVVQIPSTTGDFLLDLAVHPTTGELVVHSWVNGTSTLATVDTTTGARTPLMQFAVISPDGLDARSDGWFVLEDALLELVLVEPTTGAILRTPTVPLGQHTNKTSVAFLPDGRVITVSPSGGGFRIDPFSGASEFHFDTQGGQAIEALADGTVYSGGFNGSLWRWDPLQQSFVDVMPPGSPSGMVNGLAFDVSAEGQGVDTLCVGLPNSSGFVATLEIAGTTSFAANALAVRSRLLPTASTALVVLGSPAAPQPLGQGQLCLGAPLVRMSPPLPTGPAGQIAWRLDVTAPPGVTQGSTIALQVWHRDAPSTSNLSEAKSIVLQ